MVTAASSDDRRRVRLAVTLLLRVGVLLAVLLMHGPSSGHVMSMLSRSTSMRTSAGTTHDATSSAAQRTVGRPDAMSRPFAAPAMVGGHAMAHAECVATLPQVCQLQVAQAVVATLLAPVASRGQSARTVSGSCRAPPQLSLIRLSISRT
jgi:hypothetical protein